MWRGWLSELLSSSITRSLNELLNNYYKIHATPWNTINNAIDESKIWNWLYYLKAGRFVVKAKFNITKIYPVIMRRNAPKFMNGKYLHKLKDEVSRYSFLSLQLNLWEFFFFFLWLNNVTTINFYVSELTKAVTYLDANYKNNCRIMIYIFIIGTSKCVYSINMFYAGTHCDLSTFAFYTYIDMAQ